MGKIFSRRSTAVLAIIALGVAITLTACKLFGENCTQNSDCYSNLCVDYHCAAPASCSDGVLNNTETDVDCGGTACAPCGQNRHCSINTDCKSNNCINGFCQYKASCSNGLWDGDETSKDCGGSCAPCPDWYGCNVNADCQGNYCIPRRHYCLTACGNGVLDNNYPQPNVLDDETDVDCGGEVCAWCVDGKKCLVNSDCYSQKCQGGICVAGGNPSCTDGVQNGTETDVDCGGSCAFPGQNNYAYHCENGQHCTVDNDCGGDGHYEFCSNGFCTLATKLCSDGIKDGVETDVDCGGQDLGGGLCARCSAGKACFFDRDCANFGTCVNNVCVANPCFDGIKNNNETDVDCGGGTCMKCSDNQTCLANIDCSSNLCSAGKCVATSCENAFIDGQETDFDCGGGTCLACTDGQKCLAPTDCVNGACLNNGQGSLTCTSKGYAWVNMTNAGNAVSMTCLDNNNAPVSLPLPPLQTWTKIGPYASCLFIGPNMAYAMGVQGQWTDWEAHQQALCQPLGLNQAVIGFAPGHAPGFPCN